MMSGSFDNEIELDPRIRIRAPAPDSPAACCTTTPGERELSTSAKVLTAALTTCEPSAFTRLSALGVEEQRVNVIVRPTAPRSAWAALGDGFRVEASILTWEGRNRLIVPGGAVFRQGAGWAVYVADGGRAHLRAIEIGRRNDSEVEVVRGLREGERVVIYPTDNVGDGVRVAPE